MLVQHRNLTHYLPRLARIEDAATGSPFEERRREARIPVMLSAVVHPLDPACRERLVGSVLDVSRAGMKLRLGRQVPIGTEMQIILEDAFILGRTRYCLETEGGYQVGLEVEDALLRPRRR